MPPAMFLPPVMKIPVPATKPADAFVGLGLRGPAPLGAMHPDVEFVLQTDPTLVTAKWSAAAQAAGLLPAPWVAVEAKTKTPQGPSSGFLADGRACGSGLALMDRDYQGQVTFEQFKVELAEKNDQGGKFAGPVAKVTHIPTGSAIYAPLGDESAWGASAPAAAPVEAEAPSIAESTAGLTFETVAEVAAPEVPAAPVAAEAPKRTRRTKAEMEAARAAEAAAHTIAPASATPAASVGHCGTPTLPGIEAPAAPEVRTVTDEQLAHLTKAAGCLTLTMNAVASRSSVKARMGGDILAGLGDYFPGADYWAGSAFDRRDTLMRNGEGLARALRDGGTSLVTCMDTPDEKALFAALLPYADVVIHGV